MYPFNLLSIQFKVIQQITHQVSFWYIILPNWRQHMHFLPLFWKLRWMFYGTHNIWLLLKYFLTFIFLPSRSFHFSAMEPSTKSNLHNRDNQLLCQEATQPNKTKISVPAESLALPEYHEGNVQTPTPSFPSFWLWRSALWQGNSKNKRAARVTQKELPGALLILVAHNDVLFVGTEGWTQAARIRVKVYSVLWNVHEGRFQDLLYFHYCSDIVTFSLHLLHFSPNDWEKATKSSVRSSR